MSKIKNSGLDQYGAESFELQQFGTSGFEGVNDRAHSDCSVVNADTTRVLVNPGAIRGRGTRHGS